MIKTRRHEFNKRNIIMRYIISALILAAIITGILLAGFSDVPSVLYEDESTDVGQPSASSVSVPLPSWLPDGYQLTDTVCHGKNASATFCNDIGEIIAFEFMHEYSAASVNSYSEDGMELLEDVAFGDKSGNLFKRGNMIFLVWVYDNHLYRLYSKSISKDSLLMIAESF